MRFGDVPTFVPGDGAEDALQLFEWLASERKEVPDRLTAIQDRLSRNLTAKYRAQRFQENYGVWSHHFVGRGRGPKLVLVIAWKDYPDRTGYEAAKFVGKGNKWVQE